MAPTALLVLVFCHLLLASAVHGTTRGYDRATRLSDKAVLHWTMNYNTRRISLALTVTDPVVLSEKGASWIGLGVSERTSGSMLGSDIVSAEFGPNMLNNCTIADRHVPFAAYPLGEAKNNATSVFPNKDDCQTDGSWRLVSCTRNPLNGTSVLEVERSLDAHDDQDRDIGPGDQAMIFAYGGSTFQRHGRERGSSRVVLYNEDGSYPNKEISPLPKDVSFTFDVQATSYSVPSANVTTYACTSVVLPMPKSGKRALVAVDPIIKSKSGKNLAHHLLLYACADTPYAKQFTKTSYCMNEGPGSPRSQCTALLYGWAVGGARFLLPDGVGYEVNSRNNYLIMETHFDNPDLVADAVDVSGARMYFADDRPIKAGVLTLGDPGVSLAGQIVKNEFEYTSSCPSNCTATWKENINVFNSGLHMHTTGRKIYTNHFAKNGSLIQNLNKIEYWSNDHQYFTNFPKPKVVRPGEKLSTTCVFDTRKVPKTKFGLETKDEMCIDFVFYYPVQRRAPTDGAMFVCAGNFVNANFSNTICGDPVNPASYSLQKNPTFEDKVGTPELFGQSLAQCSVAAPAKNETETKESSASCFPATAVVHTLRGPVQMSALQVGDEVAAGNGAFSRVFMFTHRIAGGRFRFLELQTLNEKIVLSAGHYIYANGALKAAAQVRVGDRLRLANGREERVRSLKSVEEEGLYNPQTEQGDIAVNGVVASTYTEAVPPPAAHALLAPFRAMRCKFAALEDDAYVGGRVLRQVAKWSF